MTWLVTILEFLGFHPRHHWGVPKKSDGQWVLPCFTCGKEKPTLNLEAR